MTSRSEALRVQDCSIARALYLVGERWTLLILRDVFLGLHRFDDLQDELGIARSMLADRLRGLVDEGILERRQYSDRPPRHEYHLTAKGRDLQPVLTALQLWGDRHAVAPDGAARLDIRTPRRQPTATGGGCALPTA